MANDHTTKFSQPKYFAHDTRTSHFISTQNTLNSRLMLNLPKFCMVDTPFLTLLSIFLTKNQQLRKYTYIPERKQITKGKLATYIYNNNHYHN